MTSPWVDGEEITAAIMYARTTQRINALPTGFINESNNTGTVTLNAIANFAGLAVVTFTLTSQRRVRIEALATYTPAGATAARYRTFAAYNSGASATVGSAIQVGQPADVPVSTTTPNQGSAGAEGSALLAAGTYTAYGVVRRAAGGAATDVATLFYTAVYDEGAS